MSDVLALSMRPKSLDTMIGSEKLVSEIRNRFKIGRVPKAWLFHGQTGSGKTTLARIIALGLQCTHTEQFGEFCKRCWRERREFDIDEINASKVRRVEDLEPRIEGSLYAPMPGSRRRVYILDEAHKMSDHSHNLLLKYTEDCPRTTNWIICTTEPDDIPRTLRRRCATYAVPSLDMDGVKRLVKRALKKADSDLSSQELVEKLWEKGVTSAGLVTNSVELYVAGASADRASDVDVATEVDTHVLCRSLVKGDWAGVATIIQDAKPEEAQPIRRSVAGYLKGILLAETDFSDRTKIVADAILELDRLGGRDQSMAATSAVLYKVARYFSKYKH